MNMRLGLVATLVLATAVGCTAKPYARGPQTKAASSSIPRTSHMRSQSGLACGTGIGFRNIDNHKSDVVHPKWSVEVLLSGRTTYGRHFDWQAPQVIPSGILVLQSTRHAADGGRYARWKVTGTGQVHIVVRGHRLSPATLVPGEASPTGLFEVTLRSSVISPVPGCPPIR